MDFRSWIDFYDDGHRRSFIAQTWTDRIDGVGNQLCLVRVIYQHIVDHKTQRQIVC